MAPIGDGILDYLKNISAFEQAMRRRSECYSGLTNQKKRRSLGKRNRFGQETNREREEENANDLNGL